MLVRRQKLRYNIGIITTMPMLTKSQKLLWLNQNQIAQIYKTTQENVSMHIKNIYNDKELNSD